jgi:hypothetical protein
MPRHSHDDHRSSLLPAGRRWGFGAHSLVPYLNASLQSKPGEGGAAAAESIRNPVFPQMDEALEVLERLRKRH